MHSRLTDDELVRAIRGTSRNAALPAPAELSAVEEAEARIGFAIPPLLRRLYLEVANGGFGPRGDVVGVRGGDYRGLFVDVVEGYELFWSDPDHPGPPGMVPVLDWGCALYALIDFTDPTGPVWGWDWDPDTEQGLIPMGIDLAAWLSDSLRGEWMLPRWGRPEGRPGQ
jgi:hypothetical protein